MISEFQGAYRFLSNFWPCEVEWLGDTYPTLEHAFQAAKFANHPKIVQEIRNVPTNRPGKTKEIARRYKQLIEPSWFIYGRDLVMLYLLEQKFKPGSQLATALIGTLGHELIEGNTWGDTYWGVCNGIGENRLGIYLQVIRGKLID